MVIKKIFIKQFGNIDQFNFFFQPYLTILPREYANTIMEIIQFALWDVPIRNLKSKVSAGTFIQVDIKTDEATFHVKATGSPKSGDLSVCTMKELYLTMPFYKLFPVSKEEKDRLRWEDNGAIPFDEYLKAYKNPGQYGIEKKLTVNTNGVSHTDLFRWMLRDYLKLFSETSFGLENRFRITVSGDGAMVPKTDTNPNKPMSMSEEEKNVFRILCALSVNRFWEQVEQVRNCHYEPMPFLAPVTADKLTDIKKIAMEYAKQIIISQ